MAGNAKSGTKSQIIRNTPWKTWHALKLEFLKSDYTEVAAFLKDKGIDAPAGYSRTAGWMTDKRKAAEKALAKAEEKLLLGTVEVLTDKIRRRSSWWRTIQQAIVSKFIEQDAGGKSRVKTNMASEEIFFLTKAYDIAVKGERLEDGQPTSVEKVDQVNLHTFRFDEMSEDEYDRLRVEMSRALTVHVDDPAGSDSVSGDDTGGDGGEAVAPAPLPQSGAPA